MDAQSSGWQIARQGGSQFGLAWRGLSGGVWIFPTPTPAALQLQLNGKWIRRERVPKARLLPSAPHIS